ncbi:MAG: VacB/RNase II family 3'-5' exoribonuclease [Proteobacteria bacterium]|nr:VacB/RNase II family 3'-5' exoribonuclease [Pseudomonadota bacterium]
MVAGESRLCEDACVKTRRRSFKKQQFQGRRPEGGPPRPPAPKPTRLVAQVQEVGAHMVGKVLHKELVSLDFALDVPQNLELRHGDFVEGRVVEGARQRLNVLRKVEESEAATLAAICNHGLQIEYPKEAVTEAEKLPAYSWDKAEKRVDWRKLPFVTIDGEDARDFDDAVWAEAKKNGAFTVKVAIADVAHYVAEGGDLDRAALERGNSTYFPDRVLPMLPERLSNDLCSLRPDVDRPVLGVTMEFDAHGRMVGYEFVRACIHSAARLTYTQVEAEIEGKAPALPAGVAAAAAQLKLAYDGLAKARVARGALDLDLPEVKLELDEKNRVKKVGVRPRLTSHRLIEEMMIAANVAAADMLSKQGGGGLYRIHPEPSKEKLLTLKGVLGPLGFTVPAPNAGPKGWAKLVGQVAAHPAALTLMRAILQSQQQAKYDPENIGHYGLALPLYSHFTSPIRRYADLVVHRALLRMLGVKGEDGAEVWPVQKLARIAEGINMSERKSQMAEWEARDRMVAQHFVGLVGKVFPAVVVGVQPFGCFVAVEAMAEGLLPKWLLGFDWVYVGGMNAFRKIRGGKGLLRVGSRLEVVLREADPLGGRLTFGPVGGDAD